MTQAGGAMRLQAGTDGPQATPRTLAGILKRVVVLRQALEAMIDAQHYETVLSSALDQAIALEESLGPATQEPGRTARATTTCPRCGAPARCCVASSVGGDPMDEARP